MKIKLNSGLTLTAKTLRPASSGEVQFIPASHPFNRSGLWFRPLLDLPSIQACHVANENVRKLGFVDSPFIECNGSYLVHSSMIAFVR